MAGSALAKKLKIKPGVKVALINQPEGYAEELGLLPEGAELVAGPRSDSEFIHLFVKNSADLKGHLPKAFQALKEDRMFWISFPKKSSKLQTDLTRDHGWDELGKIGLRPVSLVSINDTWSAMRVRRTESESEKDLVEAQYEGKREELRPIYDRLVNVAQGFGPDVELAPRKTYVGLMRKKVFAVIKPGATRMDLGLKLKEGEAGNQLVEAPGFGSGSITHKVALTSVDGVDEQVEHWLREAYDGAG